MNERIEQLAEQCGMTVDKYGLARDAETGLEDGVNIFKFAELIVRECAQFILVLDAEPVSHKSAARMLQEYFGVEE